MFGKEIFFGHRSSDIGEAAVCVEQLPTLYSCDQAPISPEKKLHALGTQHVNTNLPFAADFVQSRMHLLYTQVLHAGDGQQ